MAKKETAVEGAVAVGERGLWIRLPGPERGRPVRTGEDINGH